MDSPARTWLRPTLTAAMVAAFMLPAPARCADAVVQERTGLDDTRPAGAIQGIVVDAESDRPVEGAMVVLSRAIVAGADEVGPAVGVGKGGALVRTVTDGRGGYAFTDVPPGTYRMNVLRIGYRAASLWVEVPAQWRVQRSVGLAVEPVRLDAIEIHLAATSRTARSGAAPTPGHEPGGRALALSSSALGPGLDAHRLDPERLPGTGSLGEPDVLRALRRLPGISSRGDFSAAPWTRGTPWGLAPVLLDGLPLYDPLHMGGVATALSADALGEVVVLPGARAASAPEGAAGSVLLHTRRARAGAPAAAGVSPLAVSAHGEERWWNDRMGLTLSARRSWWDVTGRRRSGSDGDEDPMDYRFADVTARADLRVGGRTHVDAGLLWEDDRLDGGISDLVAASSGHWGNQLAWVAMSHRLARADLRARFGHVAYEASARPQAWQSFITKAGIPVLEWATTDLRYSSIRVEALDGDAGDRVTWSVGGDLIRQSLTQSGLDAGVRALPGVDEPRELVRGQAWIEGGVQLASVHVGAGVALDLLPDDVPQRTVRPSIRVTWSPTRRLVLQAARSVASQFAYPLATAGTTLGPALGISHLWVLAGDGQPGLSATVRSLTGTLHLADDLTVHATHWRRHTQGFWSTGVAGLVDGRLTLASWESPIEEHGRGVEVSLAWTADPVHARVGYSRGRASFSGDGADAWPSPAHRPHTLDIGLDVALNDRLRARTDLVVESGWPIVEGPSSACPEEDPGPCVGIPEGWEQPSSHAYARAPGYASVDLAAEWRHGTGPVTWHVTGILRNVLGRENAAAYRVGTCIGAELISQACDQNRGLGRFSPGLVRPTPAVALRVLF